MNWKRLVKKIQKAVEDDPIQAAVMFKTITGGEQASRFLLKAIKHLAESEKAEPRVIDGLGLCSTNLHYAYKDLLSRGFITSYQDVMIINFDAVSVAISAYRRGKEIKGTSGVVYLAQAQNYYKIGKTTNIDVRAAQIRLQMPFPVEIIHKIQCENIHAVERDWHQRFAQSRKNGEWFELTSKEIAEFCRQERM